MSRFGSAKRLASWAGVDTREQRECGEASQGAHAEGQSVSMSGIGTVRVGGRADANVFRTGVSALRKPSGAEESGHRVTEIKDIFFGDGINLHSEGFLNPGQQLLLMPNLFTPLIQASGQWRAAASAQSPFLLSSSGA